MTGLIWFVQVVHYPLFSEVAKLGQFTEYSARHSSLTTWVVGPMMVLELALALMLSLDLNRPAVTLLMLTLLIWGTTLFLSVPCHAQLAQAFDETAWRKLVSTNWIRTIAWTTKSAIMLYLLLQGLIPGLFQTHK